eukprot:SAG31_NODE_1564_length_7868_cov_5.665766_1_plen_471_part_00
MLGILLASVVLSASKAEPIAVAAAETSPAAAAAESIIRSAMTLPASAQVEEIFRRTIALQSPEVEQAAAQALRSHGFRSVLDLLMLGGGPEATELMASLRTDSQLTISARAKIRLLIGDRAHLTAMLRLAEPSVMAPQCNDQGGDAAPSSRRQLQTEQNGGASDTSSISVDTIAIMASILVGVAGYVVQAHTARRMEIVAHHQAQEMQIEEARSQRAHQQTGSQIKRTERWLDDCCRPALTALYSIGWSRQNFVFSAVVGLEVTHPEVFNGLLAFGEQYFDISKEGAWTARGSGLVYDYRPGKPAEITQTFGAHASRAATGPAVAVMVADIVQVLRNPLVRESPTAILELAVVEPNSEVAKRYRRYARNMLVPLVQLIVKAIQEHAATIELPPIEWFEATFPQEKWGSVGPPALYLYMMVSYKLGWDAVLAEWDIDCFERAYPGGSAQPYHGLTQTLTWSKQHGEKYKTN